MGVHYAVRMLAVAAAVSACADDGRGRPASRGSDEDVRRRVELVLNQGLGRAAEVADSVDDLMRPVPLLTGAEESALRRYGNAQQLARARALGVRARDSLHLEELRREGDLVPLDASTRLWIVRKLEHSRALVVPDTRELLIRIGERFQARLDSMGMPPFRLEVTSVLRTAESQADLRRTNVNAAGGVSTHEYGTTLDIAYNSFAAPAELDLGVDVSEAPWLEPLVAQLTDALLGTAATRNARELQAILGRVLRELQASGDLMVTMERRQPVYHLTLARRQDG